MKTPAERKVVAEIAINTRLSNMEAKDRHAMTAAAKVAWLQKFMDEVGPNGELDEEERRRRALYRRKVYMTKLAQKSVAARAGNKNARLREELAEQLREGLAELEAEAAGE